ncbi:hypothetical protein [Pararhodobacter sp.]|uniref:hypothetical protein n=1 Tax=Pararhodobacter sp. TaxID=2127056 RepID=UPI002AFE5B59|nr:hypothetical protein [Pararhodobacter sp.]
MRFSKIIQGLALTSSLAVCTAFPALAQIDLTALSTQTRAYDTVINWQERPYRPAGVVEYVRVPGSLILDVRMVFDGPWSDDVSRVSVSSRDIRLVLADGTELAAVGGYPNWGQATLQSRSLSGSRPRDFPDDDRDLYWNGLFVIPKGTASVTLRFGGDVRYEGDVTVPAPSAEADAASFAQFRPTAVRRFRVVELEDGRDDDAVSSSIAAPPGMVLAEIEVDVQGLVSNQVDGEDRFTWHTHNFRLVDDAGATMGLVGERFMRRILDSQFSGTNVGSSADRTMLWVVPESLTEARLLFGETEVARVALGTAAITETD